MRVAAGCAVGFVGSAVATTLAMFVGNFLSGNFGIKHALVWAVLVAVVMALSTYFFDIRGLSMLHLAVAVICGSGLPFWLEYAITGPGDGTGLWAIALIFAWFVVGTTALLVALAMWIARTRRGHTRRGALAPLRRQPRSRIHVNKCSGWLDKHRKFSVRMGFFGRKSYHPYARSRWQ